MKDYQYKSIPFYAFLAFLLSSIPLPCLAGNTLVLATQGLVNPGGNSKAGYLLINEMRVHINRTTQIMDHREVRIPTVALKPRSWVYMEIEKEPNDRYVTARKIYLLPRYIHPGEKKSFSFMK